jgi:dipeptidyl aminopeptidase/acylaminoacyl peptidase
MDVASRTLDDQTWIVTYALDNQPTHYYRYDRAARQLEFLFTNRSDLEGAPLARMHPVVIRARDGLELVSYYTLPLWSYTESYTKTEQEQPRPHEPLPLVLYVHGGPWGRDTWGYHPYHQLLANRGYAVLSVNFRSSTGFGKAFINAGNLEWGRKMHDDLIDAVEWAVAAGIADRNRIAIMGGSYGGYATLAGLTFTPDVFACGVDIVGPSNLITLLESVPEYWRPTVRMMYRRMGDPTTEEGRALLKERSPLTYAERIRKPLLIGQGSNDPRVKRAESDQIVNAMQEKDIPVTYVLYPDEGHGFARPENRLSFTAVAEAFLAKHLEEERYEPIGDDFEGTSIQVLTGVEDVPGLAAALAER